MKPKFVIGFELEGLLNVEARESNQLNFDEGLRAIDPTIDRGTDGSVEGTFPGRIASYSWDGSPCRIANDGRGIEIRTQPYPLTKGLKLFEDILEYLELWTNANNFKTNHTCGLHLNLSERTLVKTTDEYQKWYAHLVTRFPERKILQMFRRTSNDFCLPLFAKGAKRDVDRVVECLQEDSEKFTGKYQSVGIHGYDEGFPFNQRRLEFRCLGGKDYHLNHDKLHTAIDTIISTAAEAFDAVANPSKEDVEVEEYSREWSRNGYRLAQSAGVAA